MNIKTTQTLFPLVIFLSLLIREGLSLRCFECNTFGNERCENPTDKDEDLIVKCDDEQTMCRKIEQIFEIDGEENTRVQRQCATRGDIGECLERTGTNKFKSWYCHCKDKDMCNTATSTTAISTLVAGAAFASLMFLKSLL